MLTSTTTNLPSGVSFCYSSETVEIARCCIAAPPLGGSRTRGTSSGASFPSLGRGVKHGEMTVPSSFPFEFLRHLRPDSWTPLLTPTLDFHLLFANASGPPSGKTSGELKGKKEEKEAGRDAERKEDERKSTGTELEKDDTPRQTSVRRYHARNHTRITT